MDGLDVEAGKEEGMRRRLGLDSFSPLRDARICTILLGVETRPAG